MEELEMKKAMAFLLCTVMTAGMLAGCGSKTAETTASTETAASTEGSGSEAAEKTSDKKWVVATDTVFKPFEYTNDQNEFVGIDVDRFFKSKLIGNIHGTDHRKLLAEH